MVVYYHAAMCPAEKLFHRLQSQGHSEGLYNQNMTIFTISSKMLVRSATRLSLIVQHHKPGCPAEIWDYCIQSQGQSEGSRF